MFNQGDGFIVYDSKGDIVFRVDTYAPTKNRLLLMDAFGKPLLTLLPKSTLIGRSSLNVEINGGSNAMYQIEGCFSERNCTIYHVTSSDHGDALKESVATIKRKVEPTRKIVLGRDVFSLVLKAGYDAAFVMGLVLALDRIDGDDVVAPIECHKDIDA
uniref:Uncharacterized protein n=1 Tax=Chenopodium quinoa TaxID=63459 RepID=A0A803LH83_CHEQI